MCGHGIIAATTIALERALLMPGGDGRTVVYDTPAGSIRARASMERDGRVDRVAFVNVPSFVMHGGLAVVWRGRTIRADVAFGGAFYAIVDGEAAGLPLDPGHLPELRRAGMEIKAAIEATQPITHPTDPRLEGIYGVIFTAPSRTPGADLRNVTVFADAQVDRSPCGTGTAAVMAVIDAMTLLGEEPFVHESVIGTRFTGRVVARTTVGDYPAIVPEIEGSAWITGEHTFIIDAGDPLADGFRL
jgi:trans-L-3-hydroxyproline dehydratase